MNEAKQNGRAVRRFPWVNWVVLALLVVAFLALFSLRGRRPGEAERHGAVGSTLPALSLLPLTGPSEAVTLDDLKGKVALVNFWATWCGPCQRELPELATMAKSLAGDADFRLLAVSCGEEDPDGLRANTELTLQQLKVDVPTYADPGRVTRTAYGRIANFRGFPTTFLLDRDGTIRAVWEGYYPGAAGEMESLAKQLLEDKGSLSKP
jgi:thiol-disulfide isomerase/thioredoxin